jgi:Universal stress protein family
MRPGAAPARWTGRYRRRRCVVRRCVRSTSSTTRNAPTRSRHGQGRRCPHRPGPARRGSRADRYRGPRAVGEDGYGAGPRSGPPGRVDGRTLVELSETALMLVVGRHGRGCFARLLIGSTSDAVANRAKGPVVVIPDGWQPEAHRDDPVLVGGLDGTERGRSRIRGRLRRDPRRTGKPGVGLGRAVGVRVGNPAIRERAAGVAGERASIDRRNTVSASSSSRGHNLEISVYSMCPNRLALPDAHCRRERRLVPHVRSHQPGDG